MGFALSWLAVKGKARETVLAELHLQATGRLEELPESPLTGSVSADGWYLLVAQEAGHRLISPSVIGPLSRGCEVITCTVEEHVMNAESIGWRDGQQVWSVSHSWEDGPNEVSVTGSLPAAFGGIRDRFTAEQQAAGGADVDYLFEIPVELARSIAGFKHDEESPAFEEHGFEILESTEKPPVAQKSWLGRLFSK